VLIDMPAKLVERIWTDLGRQIQLGLAACLACLAGWISAPAATALRLHEVVKAMWGPGIQRGISHFPTYQDLGVSIYEDKLTWSAIAASRPLHPTSPNDPAYTWPKEVDEAVAEAQRYHIQVALQIIGAPPWANGGKPWNWAPDPHDYANFAIAAARRYPSVYLWMIWGEPSRGHNFQPFLPAKRRSGPLGSHERSAPHRYARILDAAYGALKSVSRANLVIGGMTYTTGEISPQQWIENMRLPNGKPPRLDMYGHNPFSYRDPNLANPPSPEHKLDFSDLGRLAQVVDRYLGRPGNRQPKLFLSEWSVPTAPDSEFNFYVDPLVQARWIADGLRLAKQLASVYAVGWIHLYDEPPVTRGGLLQADGTKKPGYLAWKNG
jgi:hypothetical protein